MRRPAIIEGQASVKIRFDFLHHATSPFCTLAIFCKRNSWFTFLNTGQILSNARYLFGKKLILFFGIITTLVPHAKGGQIEDTEFNIKKYEVITISSLLHGTMLAGNTSNLVTSELLILPAPLPEKYKTSTDHEINPESGFFEESTPFRVGVTRKFTWHPRNWDQTNDIIILVTREKNENCLDGKCRKTIRPVRLCLRQGSPIFALDKAQMQALITGFNSWLLNQAKPCWLTSLLDPWETPRERYTAAFESTQARFWLHCLSSNEEPDAFAITCDHFNLTAALGDPKHDWRANPESNTNGMHLVWISQGMTLEIFWGSDTGPFRDPGRPILVAQFGRPTQSGSSLFAMGQVVQGDNPFEPMAGVSLLDYPAMPPSEAPDSATQAVGIPPTPKVPARGQAPSRHEVVAPINDKEKVDVPVSTDTNHVKSIYILADIYKFGEFFREMATGQNIGKTNAALILARPITYLKEDDNSALPPINDSYADVNGVTQRFILCAFKDEKAAINRFQEGWPFSAQPDQLDTLPYAAGIFGNHAFVRVLANFKINDIAVSVPLGTPLSEVIKPMEGDLAFGDKLVLIRNEPKFTHGPFSLHADSFVRITFNDLPAEPVLSELPVAPLDSIQLASPPIGVYRDSKHHFDN